MYLYFSGCISMMLWQFTHDALWNSILYLYIIDENSLHRFTWFFNRDLAWMRAFFYLVKYGLESHYWKGSAELKDETTCMASRLLHLSQFRDTFYSCLWAPFAPCLTVPWPCPADTYLAINSRIPVSGAKATGLSYLREPSFLVSQFLCPTWHCRMEQQAHGLDCMYLAATCSRLPGDADATAVGEVPRLAL